MEMEMEMEMERKKKKKKEEPEKENHPQTQTQPTLITSVVIDSSIVAKNNAPLLSPYPSSASPCMRIPAKAIAFNASRSDAYDSTGKPLSLSYGSSPSYHQRSSFEYFLKDYKSPSTSDPDNRDHGSLGRSQTDEGIKRIGKSRETESSCSSDDEDAREKLNAVKEVSTSGGSFNRFSFASSPLINEASSFLAFAKDLISKSEEDGTKTREHKRGVPKKKRTQSPGTEDELQRGGRGGYCMDSSMLTNSNSQDDRCCYPQNTARKDEAILKSTISGFEEKTKNSNSNKQLTSSKPSIPLPPLPPSSLLVSAGKDKKTLGGGSGFPLPGPFSNPFAKFLMDDGFGFGFNFGRDELGEDPVGGVLGMLSNNFSSSIISNITNSNATNTRKKLEKKIFLIEAESYVFQCMTLVPSFASDHLPDAYFQALKALSVGIPQVADPGEMLVHVVDPNYGNLVGFHDKRDGTRDGSGRDREGSEKEREQEEEKGREEKRREEKRREERRREERRREGKTKKEKRRKKEKERKEKRRKEERNESTKKRKEIKGEEQGVRREEEEMKK